MDYNLGTTIKLNVFMCIVNSAVAIFSPAPANGIGVVFAVYTGMSAVFCFLLDKKLKEIKKPRVSVKDLYPEEKKEQENELF